MCYEKEFLDLIKRAESINGKHFSAYVGEVKLLKKLEKINELESLLISLVRATEAGDDISHWGVAPWYYEELAKLYRKQKDYAREVKILERLLNRSHSSENKQVKFNKRLQRAKELQIKHNKDID